MSVESLRHNQARSLRDAEIALLTALLSTQPDFNRYVEEIATAKVSDMSDGGMGSVEFFVPGERCLGKTLVEADYLDSDGLPVSIVVNADDKGRLYELDIWKADFSPLNQYPRPDIVKIKTTC